MKSLFLIISFVTISLLVKAGCIWGALEAFPQGGTLKKNSFILISTWHDAKESTILQLNKKYTIYLQSDKEKVKLIMQEVYTGSAGARQAIFKPEKVLKAGSTYTLHIDSLSKYLYPTNYNPLTGKTEEVTYKIIDEEDFEKPKVFSTPKIINETYAEFGCGPERLVTFDCPVSDNSPFLIKATVKNLESGIQTTFYIPIKINEKGKKTFNIGHSMGGGAFGFDKSDTFEVKFSL